MLSGRRFRTKPWRFPITATSLLIHLIGAVALLLWGTKLVQTGFSRAYGTRLRQVIAAGTRNRFVAFFSGLCVTGVLQSATATILILSSFVKKNFVPLMPALGVILGADVSTTLLAQALYSNVGLLSPILITIGVIFYTANDKKGRMRHVARSLIGLGLMLLALSLIREASAPLRGSEILPVLFQPLAREPVLAITVTAIFTWILHSSLASVLMIAALAHQQMLAQNLALTMVLGANLGGALIAFVATARDGPQVRRLSAANLIMKGTTILLCLACLPMIAEIMSRSDPARLVVNFHTGFNLLMAIMFIPFLGPLAQAVTYILKDAGGPEDAFAPMYLDERSLTVPVIAMAGAARETLRMAEIVERMLIRTMDVIERGDERAIAAIRDKDEQVDHLNGAIKLYLTRLSLESFDPKEADRYAQILGFCTNLEYCGDIIDNSLMDLAMQKVREQESFSAEGLSEIRDFHGRVLANLRLAQAIFMSEDPALATQLIASKASVREAEVESAGRHFKRLREGHRQSIATSSLHLDIIRDLRRINSYATSVAYTIISNQEKYKKKRARAKKPAMTA